MKTMTDRMKLIALAALMVTILAMSACGSDGTETDTEADTGSDTISETVSESQSETETAADVAVTFSVKDQKGTVIAGAVLTVVDTTGATKASLTTDETGTAATTLTEGTYTVSFETLPEYHLAGNREITISTGMEPLVLEVTNNTPDGSADHPFFINEDVTTVTFEANTTYYFTMFGGDRRSLVLENADVELTVDGITHTPDETGRIQVPLTVKNQQSHITYSIKSTKAQDVVITIASEPGSMDNPIPATIGAPVVSEVPKDTIMYYSFTAISTGTLTLTTTDTINNISMTNQNTSQTTNFSGGAVEPQTLAVNEGDIVIIAVSVINGDNTLASQTVTFTLSM